METVSQNKKIEEGHAGVVASGSGKGKKNSREWGVIASAILIAAVIVSVIIFIIN